MSSTIHCPFLYHTRTLLCHRTGSQRAWKRSIRQLSSQGPAADNSATAASHLSNQSSSFLQQKARDVLLKTSKTNLPPVMTASEKSEPHNLWKALNSTTSARTPHQLSASEIEKLELDYRHILSLFQPTSRPDLLKAAPDQQDKGLTSQIIDHHVSQDQNSMQKLSSRNDANSPTSENDPTTITALNILSDISSAFDQALQTTTSRPDHAIWTVCEARVFPLIKLLTSPRPSLSSHREPTSPVKTLSRPEQIHPQIPPNTPLLPLLTQLYPSALLLALRLLKYHHPTSPYTLALLPHVKSLGPTSYVLGVNTHFYNSLISVRWSIYSDFLSIEKLLAEMERNGVDFDRHTYVVLKAIEEDRLRDVQGNNNNNKMGRGSTWWERKAIKKGFERVEESRIVVARKLNELGVGVGEVMREEGQRQDLQTFTFPTQAFDEGRQISWYDQRGDHVTNKYDRGNMQQEEGKGREEEYMVTL